MKEILHSLPFLILLSVTAVGEDSEVDGLPEWIWTTGDEQELHSVEFHQEFEIVNSINEARLQLASECCSCTFSINGRVAARLDNFGPFVEIDVAGMLKRGSNRVEIIAKAADGPSAVAAAILIKDGQDQSTIRTAPSWSVDTSKGNSNAVVSFGEVSPQYWIGHRQNRVTTFDDYTQWKQAQAENSPNDEAPNISSLPGFEVDLVRKAGPDEGSWVSMAFDPEGRITIAREDQGLLRLTLADGDTPQSIESINKTLKECRGLVYAHGALYANANNSKGLYRLTFATKPGQFDRLELLREFPGGVGHGRNDLALGPDGRIYSIHGDSVKLPQTGIKDLTSPYRDGPESGPHAQGHLLRCDSNGRNWELVATGLRNPFGIDFNTNGDVFTYDADAEFDMGAPWYRPTRLNQLVAGADFGWRGLTGKWPPYQLDHADNALPTATIGKGSPTAVKFGTRSHFPKPWSDALFILDWAYGRIVACHLFPRGAGYVSRSELFLKGRPLNVTDLDFGPDGAMYFITGGRKTESSLYRVRWTGDAVAKVGATAQQARRSKWSEHQRARHRQLVKIVSGKPDKVSEIDTIWPSLSSDDPILRQTAQTALEHQPAANWSHRALTEQNIGSQVGSLLALARSAVSPTPDSESQAALSERRTDIVQKLNQLPVSDLSAYRKLSVLRTYELCLSNTSSFEPDLLRDTSDRLNSWLKEEAASAMADYAPTGAGGKIAAYLSRLVMVLDPGKANPNVVELLQNATSQHDRMLYLFLLRTASDGWNFETRQFYFKTLNEIETSFLGGDGMPRFLKRIRDEAVATSSADERERLGKLIDVPSDDGGGEALTISRPHVRNWSLDDIKSILDSAAEGSGDAANGEKLFDQVLCSRCHRAGRQGGVVGPNLTAVGNRFSRRDLLRSILAPSDVVAEKYRNVTIVTTEGKVVTGRPLSSGDYRSPSVRISTDPLDPSKIVEVLKANIDERKPSTISPMPKDLVSTLTAEEISDLLAFLTSAADLQN